LEGLERIDLHLNLRNQLRRLIKKIKVSSKDLFETTPYYFTRKSSDLVDYTQFS